MTFRDLHVAGDPFILVNAWDAGSAKMMARLGAQAIGTTSGGHSFSIGRLDMGNVTRDEAIQHGVKIKAAAGLPVSADLENGFGPRAQDVYVTIQAACDAGIDGGSIEDIHYPDVVAYEFEHAVDRVRAAVDAARSHVDDFVFVARADGLMNGLYDFDEAVRRAIAFAHAGADCVYVPKLASLDQVKTLCEVVDCPVNVLGLGGLADVSRDAFAAAGVARISVGSGLARRAYGAAIEAAREMIHLGDFTQLKQAVSGKEIAALLQEEENDATGS